MLFLTKAHTQGSKTEIFRQEYSRFYEILQEKAQMIGCIGTDSEEWRLWSQNLLLEKQPKKEHLQKCAVMKYSILYYADMMTHVMMLIDEKIADQNKSFLEPIIQKFVKTVLDGLSSIDLDRFKKDQDQEGSQTKIHAVYFQDAVYIMNKTISLVCRLLQKVKNQQSQSQAQNLTPLEASKKDQVMSKLSRFIEDTTERGQRLVNLVVGL